MADREEWGPWVEHDGQPVPHLNGKLVRLVAKNGRDEVGIMRCADWPSCASLYSLFIWVTVPERYLPYKIIRYRVCKPRALSDLQALIADLPEPAPAPIPVKEPEPV